MAGNCALHGDFLCQKSVCKPLPIVESNTEPLVVCAELFSFWRLREPWHEVKAACHRHKPHDGLPHVTYIDGVGWYEWEQASPALTRGNADREEPPT